MDQDDYWNESQSKSFCFDEESEEKLLDDDVSEISTKSSVIPLSYIISSGDLQTILDEENISEYVIPKGLSLEEEVKFLRRRINEIQYSDPNLTVTKLLLGKQCSLESHKTLKEKEELLDEAIRCGNGDAILQIVFFLKNTLKSTLFLRTIGNRYAAVDHYINYLTTTMRIGEATEILTMLDRQQEVALMQFKVIVQSKNSIQKLEKLKKVQELFNLQSSNPFLLNQVKFYISLLELQINERIYFQPHDVLDKSILETLYYACEKFQKFSDSSSSSRQSMTNPFKMCEQYSISSGQFEWIALNQRAKVQAWRDIESLFEKKSTVLKQKTFVINIPLEIVILKLHHLRAPQAVLNSFLQHIEDPERRLQLSKKVGAIHSIVDSLAILKDKSALEEFKESLPNGTAEYFYTEKAITTLSNTKSILGMRKSLSNNN